jgi:hypothetical protein
MVFVAVIPFPIPFGPLGIGIFLAPFGFLPVLGNLTLLYPGVLFPAVSLLRRRNNAGINNLPLPGGKSAFPQKPFKLSEQLPGQPCLGQLFPEQPDRLCIRHPAAKAQPQKPHERKSVKNLIPYTFIRKVVQGLKDNNLKHQHNIIGLCSRIVLFLPPARTFSRVSLKLSH